LLTSEASQKPSEFSLQIVRIGVDPEAMVVYCIDEVRGSNKAGGLT